MSNITTINTANYADMAKAMGVSVTTTATPEERLSLPRLRISHQPVMGIKSIDGEDINVEVVKGGAFRLEGGTFKLEGDNNTIYSTSITIRPFLQRYMYKRFIKGTDTIPNKYVKTIMADNLNIDLKDTDGGFNCGKPAGYIKDWQALPKNMQELIRSIKRVRVVIGMVSMENAKDEKGNKVSVDDSPFIWEIDNREAYKAVGDAFNTLGKHKRLPLQHKMVVNTEERQIPSGAKYYVPSVSINLTDTLEITQDDQEMFGSFMQWIDNYNSYVSNKWSENVNSKMNEDDVDVIDVLVEESDIEVEVA
jgi:hypothetical protein